MGILSIMKNNLIFLGKYSLNILSQWFCINKLWTRIVSSLNCWQSNHREFFVLAVNGYNKYAWNGSKMTCMVDTMGLLPDTQNCGCARAGNAGNVFPVTAGKRSQHASRHVRDARAVMHAGIANLRFPLRSAAGENVPGIPRACATCNFTYLVRGP